jgi:hypothetical protein
MSVETIGSAVLSGGNVFLYPQRHTDLCLITSVREQDPIQNKEVRYK